MAAAIDAGITAHAQPNGTGLVRVYSEGFAPVQVSLDRLWPDEKEAGTSAALVRGMAAVLSESAALQGVDIYMSSDLAPGRGLGSSAAFSVLTGYVLAFFSSQGAIPAEELARAAQKAENRWFGKPCGLMDQMACAMGGGLLIDFLENRTVPIDCCFDDLGLALCLTDTGGSHAQAGAAYGKISGDMSQVAQSFGESFLAQVRPAAFEERWPEHETELPWMRARHFFDETWRMSSMADALGLRDGQRYMELMNESGRSSERLLQNIWQEDIGEELARGLTLSEQLLTDVGAWRVHGGGFAGCVQALMPEADFEDYRTAMDGRFGPGSCQRVHISTRGVCVLPEDQAVLQAATQGE